MGTRSDKDSDSQKNRKERMYASSEKTTVRDDEFHLQLNNAKREYQITSVPKISLTTSKVNIKSETLKEALIRDIGEDLSELELDFVSKYMAISGTTLSYLGTKKEQKINFNKFVDDMIHKFPNLAMKLSSVQLNYTMNFLKQTMEEDT